MLGHDMMSCSSASISPMHVAKYCGWILLKNLQVAELKPSTLELMPHGIQAADLGLNKPGVLSAVLHRSGSVARNPFAGEAGHSLY
jgi:hypothetical protein